MFLGGGLRFFKGGEKRFPGTGEGLHAKDIRLKDGAVESLFPECPDDKPPGVFPVHLYKRGLAFQVLEFLRLVSKVKGLDHFLEIPVHDLVKFVECQADPVVRQPVLGEIVGPDPL